MAFIHAYANLHGVPPAESEIAAAILVAPPSVNQMVKTLEKKGLIHRNPGQPRSIRVLLPEDEIPSWNGLRKSEPGGGRNQTRTVVKSPPANLYVLSVCIMQGPVSEKFAGKRIGRDIEIRGDQTLEALHNAIFKAFDRWDEHMYEFQFGKRPFDPKGPNYGLVGGKIRKKGYGDVRTTKMDDLGLKKDQVFGYWFDFGDDWFHQIDVIEIEQAIPTVEYPRVIKRVGKSPPQYLEE